MVKKSHRIKEEIGSSTDEVVTIHDQLRRERLLRDTDKNILIIPRAITDWLLRSYFYISFVSLSTCSFHLREQMKTILVPIVYSIHIYSVQNKDGRNQERALLAPPLHALFLHIYRLGAGARVSPARSRRKRKRPPSFSVVSKLDGPIRCAPRSTAKKRRARASSFLLHEEKEPQGISQWIPELSSFFFFFVFFPFFSSSSPLR